MTTNLTTDGRPATGRWKRNSPQHVGALARRGGVHRLLPLLVLCLVGMLALPVKAEQRPDLEASKLFIGKLAETASAALLEGQLSVEEREARLRDLLLEGFAVEVISRVALGKQWRRISPEERAEFVAVFTEFALNVIAPRLAGVDNVSLTVEGARPRGKRDVLVQTKVRQADGPPVSAGWRVRRIDGEIKIIDVVVAGVSLTLNQRQEFEAVLRESGFQGLLNALRETTVSTQLDKPAT